MLNLRPSTHSSTTQPVVQAVFSRPDTLVEVNTIFGSADCGEVTYLLLLFIGTLLGDLGIISILQVLNFAIFTCEGDDQSFNCNVEKTTS